MKYNFKGKVALEQMYRNNWLQSNKNLKIAV